MSQQDTIPTGFGRHVAEPRPKYSEAEKQRLDALNLNYLNTEGQQWRFKFANGYGASVINDGYGSEQGLYELAVLGPDGHLTYSTPITDDVLGYLTAEDVAETLDRIEALA